MFVGHYAAACAAKAVKPTVPLWVLFVAVQLVDFAWAIFIVLGVEQAQLVPGFVAASNLDLYHMPYTHSLLAAIIWSVAFGALYLVIRQGSGTGAAIIVGLAVLSHWLTDLLVHVPDLPLLYDEPKVGFGLWRHFWISQILEVGLLLGAVVWYVRSTAPRGRWGRIAPWALFGLLVAVQAYSHAPVPDPAPAMSAFAIQAFLAYSAFALLAWLTERTRIKA